MNHPLARALRAANLTAVDIAARLGVDPKTVARWMAGRVPYPRYRDALVQLTGWSAAELWPDEARSAPPLSVADELRVMYPHRSDMPADAWLRMATLAESEISVLAYSALFLAENAEGHRLMKTKAQSGVRIRIALGDPDGRSVAQRGTDEGLDEVIVARIRNALILFAPLVGEPGVELRLHDTTLYNSIYRADDELLINTHVYGCPASHAPVFHLRRLTDDGMAASYLQSFDRVWTGARELPVVSAVDRDVVGSAR